MRNEHPADQDAAVQRQANAEWHSLLARLRSGSAGDLRLQRVRHAIASGEFQVDARKIARRLIEASLTS